MIIINSKIRLGVKKQTEKITPKEIWKPVKDFEGLYEISNYGNVRSLDRCIEYNDGRIRLHPGTIISLHINKNRNGYVQVSLYKGNIRYEKKVHRLVAEAFIPNPNNLPQVNHKDENTKNNFEWNLEWCDCRYNNSYGTKRQRLSEWRTNYYKQIREQNEGEEQ